MNFSVTLLSQPLSFSHSIYHCGGLSQFVPEERVFNLIITAGCKQVYSSSNHSSLSFDDIDESTTREQGTAAPHSLDTITVGLSVAGSALILIIVVVIVCVARKL